MFEYWSFWLSAITATTAVVALILTFLQIRMSNKQSLFDRRLEAFIKINGMVQLYTENGPELHSDIDDDTVVAVDLDFLFLTNNSYLEEIGGTIQTPLEASAHELFLKKIEDIKQLSVETELIFNGKNVVKAVCSFVTNYEELLLEMYRYQILLKHMKEYSDKFRVVLEDAQKAINEPERRKRLFSSYEAISDSYNLIVQANAIEKLKDQIKL